MKVASGFAICMFACLVAMITCVCHPKVPGCQAGNNPVCATFQKTFNNDCELQAQLCKLARNGFELVGDPKNRDCCVKGCSRLSDPTCGCDGIVYGNQCLLEVGACEKKDCIKAVDPSNCPTFPFPNQ